jgi:hypothetical protein
MADSRALLAGFRRRLEEVSPNSREGVTDLLIDFGVIESAIADALCPDRDAGGPVLDALRAISVELGHLFRGTPGRRAATIREALDRIAGCSLPRAVRVGVPEGYSHYGVYPDMYRLAAERFWLQARPAEVVIIGIRSVGTSLSAVVAAELEARGCRARSCTVRPRGHPFDRRLHLAPEVGGLFRFSPGAFYLSVDEGPGLSGSSFLSVAEKLAGHGVPEERIAFFPSWDSSGAQLRSAAARERWRRYKRYSVSFEEAFPAYSRLIDVSAGRWRRLFYPAGGGPAVQAQHERRKYLDCSGGQKQLLKFAGLGRYGRARLQRARQLFEAGFGSRVYGLKNGFLLAEFSPGTPLSADGAIGLGAARNSFLDYLSRYLSWVAQNRPSGRAIPFDDLLRMIETNVSELLGPQWTGCVAAFERSRGLIAGGKSIELDGRMLPHEWLATPDGWRKTDGVEHHDDHFFPGCQDIAWDIAGAQIEFSLGAGGRDGLTRRFLLFAPDAALPARLPFYRLAYLAYRAGYSAMQADSLKESPDGRRFRALSRRYTALLKREIRRSPRSPRAFGGPFL